MASTTNALTVRIYGVHTTSTLLAMIAHLTPLLGARLSVWLANRILHWLVWAKVGRTWRRIGNEMDVRATR